MQYLSYDLDKRGHQSLQVFLASCIETDIQNGRISAGEKLPSKRTLAKHLGISPLTVALAYERLKEKGLILAREKSGYFVAKKAARRARKAVDASWFSPGLTSHFLAGASLDMKPWEELIKKTLQDPDFDMSQPCSFAGLVDLRQAISEYLYRYRGMDVKPAQIIIGAGAEYLYTKILQLLPAELPIAFEDPGYKKFVSISHHLKRPVQTIPVDSKGLQVETLARSTAKVVHVSPVSSFPTGIGLSDERREELLRWVSVLGEERYIIEDDFDSELAFDERDLAKATLFSRDESQHTIYLNSFSKTIMPSLRISYLVLPERLLRRYIKSLSFYSSTVSVLEQKVLARYIQEGHFVEHLEMLRNYFSDQRHLVIEAISKSRLHELSSIIQNRAGTHFMLMLKADVDLAAFKSRIQEKHFDLCFLSDYSFQRSALAERTLVINFASLARHDISKTIKDLEALVLGT